MTPDIIVDIGAALICIMSTCYPALVGKDTPIGEFTLSQYTVRDPRYGGDILVFKETQDEVYAIHRVIHVPGQSRAARLQSSNPDDRKFITAGCVNVEYEIYDLIVDCCSNSKIIIK